MACRRFGGEGACPKDFDAPRSDEGAIVAALLPVLLSQSATTMARLPEFQIETALRLIEAEGVAPPIAAVMANEIQSGIRRAQALLADRKGE